MQKKGGVFKYPKVFQCDNRSEFKSDERKMLEKHDYIRRTTTKYKQTHYALPEDGLCRYLYQPGKQHGDKKIPYLEQKYIATRSNSSGAGNPVLYYFERWD